MNFLCKFLDTKKLRYKSFNLVVEKGITYSISITFNANSQWADNQLLTFRLLDNQTNSYTMLNRIGFILFNTCFDFSPIFKVR